MSATLLKGRAIAERTLGGIRARAAAVEEDRGAPPHLAILSVGGAPSAEMYLKKRLEACREAGIETTVEALPESVTQAETSRILGKLSQDPPVDGIILDMPLPAQLDPGPLLDAIAQDKDVEGLTTLNSGKLYSEKAFGRLETSGVLIPCTARAIIELLFASKVRPEGKSAVVLGRSSIVGRPVAHILSCLDATVTLCHSKTEDLAARVREADILVAAIGRARFVQGEWIKPGAVVIDAGTNRDGKKTCGDVDFEAAAEPAAFITPVPGGVGPLTVTYLLHNTVLAAERHTRGLKG